MKYSEYNPNKIEEINHLFIKTFTDSEGKSEGLTIGELTNNFMTNTDAIDFFIQNRKKLNSTSELFNRLIAKTLFLNNWSIHLF